MLETQEASRIAFDLVAKYGREALDFAQDRAARAVEVGDDFAYSAWQSVIEATQGLLRPY
jgi:hypothetical protein